MTDAYDAYKMYLGLRLHFNDKSYDYIKYNGAVNCSKDSFMQRSDRYFFHKMGKKYNGELEPFLVSNFASGSNVNPKWLTTNEAETNYSNWKKNQQSITRKFDQDLKKCLDIYDSFGIMFITESKNSHPPIVKLIQQKKLSIESAIILDHFLNWIDYVNREVGSEDEWVWPSISKMLRKCKPFIKFNETKCKEILKNRVDGVLQRTISEK
jgi:hypothetical protein